jgi:hypothetical protein
MSANFVINEGHRIVFSLAAGQLTYADCVGHMDRLLADARFRPDMRQIIDFNDVSDVELTNDQIRELAARTVFGSGSRRAFVASTDVLYGLARMFQTHREFEGETGIAIFRDMAEATMWVEVPVQAVDAAFAELRNRHV